MGSSKNCHRRIWKLSTNLCSGFYTSLGLREKSDSSENSKAPRLGLAPGGVLAQLLRKRRREPQATRLPGSQNAKTGGSALLGDSTVQGTSGRPCRGASRDR